MYKRQQLRLPPKLLGFFPGLRGLFLFLAKGRISRKNTIYVISLSGGKDSTTLLLRLLEEGRPVDVILFSDTGLEFPQMYEPLNKLAQYTGRTITRLKPPHRFETFFYEYSLKRKTPALDGLRGLSLSLIQI